MSLVAVAVMGLLAAVVQRMIAVRVWGTPQMGRGFTGDASVHFAIIRHLAHSPRSRFIENYLISPEPMSYPIAFHRFAGLLSTTTLSQRPWLPNMILHLLGCAFLVIISGLISGGSLVAVAVTLVTYLVMPSIWVFSGPSVTYLGLSARYLARLSSSAAYLGLVAGTVLDSMWLLGVGAAMAALGVLTAQFARQSLFFCVPLLSLVLLDARPTIFLLLGVALAVLIGWGHVLEGLRHTALRWRLYRTRTKQSAHVQRVMLGFFRWNLRGRVSLKAVVFRLMERDPTRTVFWYPELFLVCAFVIVTPFEHSLPLGLALLPPVILYLVTLTERFNHLGEAYRYIEYSLFFLVPVVVGLSFNGSAWQFGALYAYLAFCVAVILLRYAVQIVMHNSQTSPRDEISQFVQETGIEGPAIIFPVSMRLGADLIARRQDWKTFWWQPGIISERIYDEYIEEYPFLKRDWRPLAVRHGVTHIFCDKQQDEKMKDWTYDFSGEEKIAENENFVAYRVRSTEDEQQNIYVASAGATS